MRVATNSMIQSALADLMTAQRNQFEANQQVSTGKKAPDLKGYGNDSQLIISQRASLTIVNTYRENNEAMLSRMQVQDLAYEELDGAFNDLRTAISTTDGRTMMSDIEAAFQRMTGALETKFAGKYLFSGMSTDRAPIAADSVADLQAAVPDTSAVFVHSERRENYKLDENAQIELNATAEEVVGDAFAIIERIADFNAGPNGPFGSPMTNAQMNFLSTEITNLVGAFDTMTQHAALSGATHARVERTASFQSDHATYLELIVGDLEDVDMAEAATRLTQAQAAVQVSAATFSTLTQVSLLNYL